MFQNDFHETYVICIFSWKSEMLLIPLVGSIISLQSLLSTRDLNWKVLLAPMVLMTFSKKYASRLRPGAHFSGASVFVTFRTLCLWCPHNLWEHTFQQNQLLALGEKHIFVEVALEISQTPPGGARKRLQLCISAFLHLCIRAFLHTAQLTLNSRSTHAQLALILHSTCAQLTLNWRSTDAQLTLNSRSTRAQPTLN